jgi:SAM-dependent MidA family methyltransferase
MNKGVVLLIDYGMGRDEYFHPQRNEGTLRCYYQHKANDNPFELIGDQDIATSVHFSDIAEQAFPPEKSFGSLFNQTTLSINSGRALLIVSFCRCCNSALNSKM